MSTVDIDDPAGNGKDNVLLIHGDKDTTCPSRWERAQPLATLLSNNIDELGVFTCMTWRVTVNVHSDRFRCPPAAPSSVLPDKECIADAERLGPRRLVDAELGRSRSRSSGRLARWTVVIGLDTNSPNDFDVARGQQLLAALDYLTRHPSATPHTTLLPRLAGGKSAHTRFRGAYPFACGRIQPLHRDARPSLHRRSQP